MSTVVLVERIDDVLKPLGFKRTRRKWVRGPDPLIDVVDIQISKAGDSFTINAGVLDRETYSLCWGADPRQIGVPACAIRARVGDLTGDEKDLWWPIDGPDAPERAAAAVAERVVPFLESMHSREAMVVWLQERALYPPDRISLAILLHLQGDVRESCSMLHELLASTRGAWRDRVADLAALLECS